MNRRHRSAQLAGRASVKLHTLIFFSGDAPKEEDAYILNIETAAKTEPSFTVMVPRYGIEGQVQLPIEADDPKLHRFPDEHKITYDGPEGKNVSLQVFDKVIVSIWVNNVQDDQQELVIDIVEPKLGKDAQKNEAEPGESVSADIPKKRTAEGGPPSKKSKKKKKR